VVYFKTNASMSEYVMLMAD